MILTYCKVASKIDKFSTNIINDGVNLLENVHVFFQLYSWLIDFL